MNYSQKLAKKIKILSFICGSWESRHVKFSYLQFQKYKVMLKESLKAQGYQTF